MLFKTHECVIWVVIYVTLCVTIVTLNTATIVAFMRNCNLRKRSTYLLINLAVTDMFFGFMGTCTVYELGVYCSLWRDSLDRHVLSFAEAIRLSFTTSSLINITNISLERMHATLCPLRHRFVKKWFYWLVIVASYLLAALLSFFALGFLNDYSLERSYKVISSFTSVCVPVITLCYFLILSKVKCRPHPRHHVEVSRERKLTVTLLIVTMVSLLMWLPFIVQSFLWFTTKVFSSWPSHLTCFIILLLGANSLVNPILYVIRIPEFKRAVKKLFCKTGERRRVQDVCLHAIQKRSRENI